MQNNTQISIRTLCILVRSDPEEQVLLGYKKAGYGVGKYTGFGGKVEPGETIAQAAARELEEETSIQVALDDLQAVGRLNFVFPYRPEWTQEVHVFTAAHWLGEAKESREMIPQWFKLDEIPYDGMWQDGHHWLPPILEGEFVQARFTFREDNETLDEIVFEEQNTLPPTQEVILEQEERIEAALWSLEVNQKLDQAMAVYKEVEAELASLNLAPGDAQYPEQQRVLAYCLLRQGNILRQKGDPQGAFELGRREIEAARASGGDIALARSLMSYGTNSVVAGDVDGGLQCIEEAQELFECCDSEDHKQGYGWCFLLRADLINAGLLPGDPTQVIQATSQALEALLPIENWPGVVRAFAARAQAHEALGDTDAASSDREELSHYERKSEE